MYWAQGYRWIFGVPAPFDYYSLSAVPAGFLVSSAEDMTHYLVAQMNGGRFGSATVLSPTGIATMHAPGGALAGPLGILPGLLVVAYLVIPIAIAAFLFQRRDMVGVG